MPLAGEWLKNTTAFKTIMMVAAFAGVLAGLLLTLMQQIEVVPLILAAEAYEQPAGLPQPAGGVPAAGDGELGSWQPDPGWPRHVFTAAANIVVALGFSLLLIAAVTLRGAALDWRRGVVWGLGGYVVFFAAPSFGLPPEVPGTEAAHLLPRQLWWAATSLATALGLAMIVFSQQRAINILGGLVLLVPHLIGAPQPDVPGSAAPAELTRAFLVATAVTNAVFWLALGGLLGYFHHKVTT